MLEKNNPAPDQGVEAQGVEPQNEPFELPFVFSLCDGVTEPGLRSGWTPTFISHVEEKITVWGERPFQKAGGLGLR